MRYIDKIILHCSDTPEGRNVTAAEVDRWHRAKGWQCIGYHYFIRLDGTIEQGRTEAEVGAHCYGQNQHSIGICYAGGRGADGKPKDTRTPEQRTAMHNLVAELLVRHPHATLYGHNKFANKACPCFDVATQF